MVRYHDSADDVPDGLRIPTWSWDGLEGGVKDTPAIRSVDAAGYSFVIDETLAITQRRQRPGPPERLPGMTLAIIDVEANAPHGGEMHPDGDELLYVISGRLRVVSESDPSSPVVLGAGQACIVRRGEWHKVEMIEPAQLLHVTPGPNGDHRPLVKDQN